MGDYKDAEDLKDDGHIYEYINQIKRSRKVETGP